MFIEAAWNHSFNYSSEGKSTEGSVLASTDVAIVVPVECASSMGLLIVIERFPYPSTCGH